ncbi:hypothetical protein B566_EDAN004392 [Ephemera danica]|nr:hypothetical protein B566_EDAN004392 [Ephemera danica]
MVGALSLGLNLNINRKKEGSCRFPFPAMLPSLWLPPKECDQQPRSAVPPLEIDYGGYSEYPGSLASSPSGSVYGTPRNGNVLSDLPYPPYSQSHSPCSGLDHVYQPTDPLFPCSNDCTGGFYNNLRTDLHTTDLSRTYNATITFQHAKRKRTLSMSSLDTQASKKSCTSSGSSGDSESSFSPDTEMRFIKIEDVSPLPASDQLSVTSYSPSQLYTKSPDNLPLKYNIVPLKPVSRARFVASPSVFPSPYDYSRHTASLKYHHFDSEPLNLTKTQNKDSNRPAVSFESHGSSDLTMDLRVRRTEVPDVAANSKVHTHTGETHLVRNGPSDIVNKEKDSTPSCESVENSEYLRTCSTSSADENNTSEDSNLKETSNNSDQVEDSECHGSLEYLCLQEFFQNWKEESPSASVIDTDSFDTVNFANNPMHDPLDSTAGNQEQENPNCEDANPTNMVSTDVPVCGPYSSSTSLPAIPIHAKVNEGKEGEGTLECPNYEIVPAYIPSPPALKTINIIDDRDIDDTRKIQKDTVSSKHEFISKCLDIEIAPPTLVLETLNIIKGVTTEAVDTGNIQNELKPQSIDVEIAPPTLVLETLSIIKDVTTESGNIQNELKPQTIDVEIAPFTSVFKTIHIIEDTGAGIESSDTGKLQDKQSPSLVCHSVDVQRKSVFPSMPLLGGEPELPPIAEEEQNEIDVSTPEQDDSSNAAEPASQTDTFRTDNNLSDNESEKMEHEGPDEDSKTNTDQANGVSDMIEKLKTPTLPRNSTMNFLRFFGSDETALDEFLQRPCVAAQCGNPIRSMTPTPKTPSRIKSRRRHSEGAEIDFAFTPRLLRSHQKMTHASHDTTETPKSSTRSTRRNTTSLDAQGAQSPTTFSDESNPPKTRSQSPPHSPCAPSGSKTPGSARAKSKQPRQRKVSTKKGKKKTQLAVPETFTIAEDANSESKLDAASLYVKREREKMLLHDSWLEQRRLLYAAYLPDVPLQGSENMHPVVLLERNVKLDELAKSLMKQPQ